METRDQLPEYSKPPVIEVVCGVLFESIEGLLAPHLGLLWNAFKADYPQCQEHPPLAPVIEQFGESTPMQFELTGTPPLPRTWFIQSTENGIVQVQRDRFLHNWKKVQADDEYPRFSEVISMFRERLASFDAFLAEAELGPIRPRQYELTYVNHIPADKGFEGLADIGEVLPDSCWRKEPNRFLPEPDGINWRTSFRLPECAGRLHVTVRSAVRQQDQVPILLLELTARGIGEDPSRKSMWAWFDTAHEWIVRGFTDLTSGNLHTNVWRRTR